MDRKQIVRDNSILSDREMEAVEKQFLILRFYKISGGEIAEINERNLDYKQYKINLPIFTFDLETSTVKESESWFQFHEKCLLTTQQQAQEFILFDFIYATPLLQEEINTIGIEEFIGAIDLKKEHIQDFYHNFINSGLIPTESIFEIIMHYGDWENPDFYINKLLNPAKEVNDND